MSTVLLFLQVLFKHTSMFHSIFSLFSYRPPYGNGAEFSHGNPSLSKKATKNDVRYCYTGCFKINASKFAMNEKINEKEKFGGWHTRHVF